MKRSRHRWLGCSIFCVTIVVLSLEIPTTSAARATSLIFAKTTTTTAAPEEPSAPENGEQLEPTAEGGETNTTSKLTGIPQIDYIYDPNLPRELNGYNLSSYPFYETVPPLEMIDFKCDGLHDGFYASVPHGCQLYHHCLFGTRYDFLCANYTAFDQKTVICQFVSEVDCKNSPNYFNRNEALYKAASTTTIPPPTTSTTTTTTTPRPHPRPRRPHRYDYYDDDYYYPERDDYDYEQRGGRRPRPRPRPQGRPGGRKRRPVDDYEDDRYERRPRPRDEQPEDDYEDRRPYDRPNRPAKRPYSDRRPYEDEEDRPGYRAGNRRPRPRDEEEERYREDDRPRQKDKPNEKRPRDDPGRDDMRNEKPREGFRPRDEGKTREEIRPRDEIKPRDEMKPRDEIRSRDEIRPRDEKRPRDEIRSRDEIRPRDEGRHRDEVKPKDEGRTRDEIRPRDERRPSRDEGKPSRPYSNEGRRYRGDRENGRDERPNSKPEPRPERNYDDERVREERRQPPTAPEAQTLVKPNGRGIFSQPRMAPKIKRPVPATEKDKYGYVPIATTKAPLRADDDEYYDDYEEEDTRRPSSSGKNSQIQQRPKPEPVEKEKFKPSRPHYSSPAPKIKKNKRPIDYEDDEYYYEPPVKSQKYTYNQRNKETPKVKVTDEYYDDYEDRRDSDRDHVKTKDEDITSRIKDLKPNVKVLKRPFLPSRGGSPYLPRGLQPVAGKDLTAPPNTTPKPTTTTTSTTTTTTTTTTTPKPTTTTTTTTRPTTTTTTTTTTRPTTTTTTEEPTTTITTGKPTTTELTKDDYEDDVEEYYDEEDIDYDRKETTTEELTTHQPSTTRKPTTTHKPITTQRLTTTATAELTTKDQAKNLAAKVLRIYNDQYHAIKEKLETTLSPGDYLKPYLEAEQAAAEEERRQEEADDYNYRPTEAPFKPSPQLPEVNPEISKPYTATGKPLRIPENISIKQNLADSIENDYDVALNEALAPALPNVNVRNNIPSGFMVPGDRDYTYSRFRSNFQQEPQFAASELNSYQIRKRPQISGVSIRTPSSYFLQPQRYQDGVQRPQRHLVYDPRPQSHSGLYQAPQFKLF